MKKLLSVLLAATTVVSLGGAAVYADGTDYDISDLPVYYDNNKDIRGETSPGVFGTNDTVTPDQKVYVKLSDVADQIMDAFDAAGDLETARDELGKLMDDEDYFKFKYKKGSDNSKMILGISLVEKKLGNNPRDTYIEIKLADDYTDDEYKINPTFTFTAKDDLIYDGSNGVKRWYTQEEIDERNLSVTKTATISDGDKFEGEFTLWISNTELEADEDFAAGTGGVTLKPTKNDDNEIVWYDENDDIAMLTFEGDSSVDNFYPKLSTKWDNSTYATYFADQDAFIFDFISNPDISSTSRPVLTIYDPYYDYEEDESLVDSENVVIYQVVDGELVDVTADWSYGETDDGEMAYTTKTRQLGTYIFCEVAVAGSEEVVEEPVDDGKVIPNTGR